MCCTLHTFSLLIGPTTLHFILPRIWHRCLLQEDTLCRFVAVLAYHHKLKHRTIKSYLSGLRFFHIQEGLGNPWLNLMPRLEYTLQGVKRVEAHSGSTARSRLPITLDVLLSLKSIWCPRPAAAYDGIMLWAAACVRFFGFLRVGNSQFHLHRLTIPMSTSIHRISPSTTTRPPT